VARAIRVKNQNCCAFISFHCNASAIQVPRGISCWIRAGDSEDRNLAQTMIQSLRKLPFPMPIWGVSGIFEDTQSHVKKIAILRSSGSVPSVLVEVGFLSNFQDATLLKDPKFRQQVAERMRDGIIKYLSQKRRSV
jgi:N-acetylmuramoyl-L-alanine amidase